MSSDATEPGHLDSAAVTTVPGGAGAADPVAPPAPAQRTAVAERLAVLAAAATVAVQITYPLLHGPALRYATVAAVIAFVVASAAHAAAWFGSRAATALLTGACLLGLAAEAVGVATSRPFGRYVYADTLGPRVLGVPLVVPLAWAMMAYPALLAARRLSGRVRHTVVRRVTVALLGGVVLAAWDLFLDPQMVAAGHWSWAHPSPSLPGVPTVPLTNTIGWLLVGAVMTALLDRLLPGPTAAPVPVAVEVLPAALLVWTWLGSLLANLVFFDRPQVALLGGAGMALVVGPYVLALVRAAEADR